MIEPANSNFNETKFRMHRTNSVLPVCIYETPLSQFDTVAIIILLIDRYFIFFFSPFFVFFLGGVNRECSRNTCIVEAVENVID